MPNRSCLTSKPQSRRPAHPVPRLIAPCAALCLSQDDYWQSLVLGMIGETIDPADEICGARVVDKSTGSRQMYRLELWFKRKDQATADELLSRMSAVLGPTSKTCKWEFRAH
jgi:hypothetical protein